VQFVRNSVLDDDHAGQPSFLIITADRAALLGVAGGRHPSDVLVGSWLSSTPAFGQKETFTKAGFI